MGREQGGQVTYDLINSHLATQTPKPCWLMLFPLCFALGFFFYNINESRTFEVEGEKVVYKEAAVCLGITE